MTIQFVEAPPGRVVRPIEAPAVPFETRTEPTALRVRGIGKSFGATQVLREIDLDVARGEFVALLGPSGCGKTTLLRIIAGLEAPTQGRTFLGGTDATAWSPGVRRCGIVFQSYALFPTLTALANVEFAVDRRRHARRARHDLAMESLALVGLADAARKRPSQLSGGQQQRVALARALASEPQLLLLDEPLSALDAKVREHLRGEIRRIQRKLNLATILVTHDQEEAMALADRVAVMRDGRIVQTAPPRTIYQQPSVPFVAEFIGTMNFLPGWTVRNEREVWRDGVTFRTAALINAPVGSSIQLGFRPEDVRVHPGGPHDGDNRLAATLDRREFRGATWRLYFRSSDAEAPQPARPGLIAVDAADTDVARCAGESHTLHIPPERVYVFPEPRGDAA